MLVVFIFRWINIVGAVEYNFKLAGLRTYEAHGHTEIA